MLVTGQGHTINEVFAVAVANERVELDAGQLKKVRATYERVQEWGQQSYPIYGVNTGFGELINFIVPPRYKSDLQRHLLLSHAAGGGPVFAPDVVRAMMLARINCHMKGHSGVSPRAVEMIAELLNLGLTPRIPEQGSLGASGDLATMSHLALPLIGYGHLRKGDGEFRPAADVLAEVGMEPLELGYKEALSLINGTSGMTGAAALALVKAYRLARLSLVASADVVQALHGSTRPFAHEGHELKNHRGQILVAEVMRELLAGSERTREHADIMKAISERVGGDDVADSGIHLQSAYSLRCIPQVIGPVIETLDFCKRIVEEELNSCNDNPLFFDRPENSFHGANFHGQYVAMACDYLNIALAEIGVLVERQLNRLVDPHLNGHLSPFLASGEPGLFSGYEGGQYLATSIASENLDLAAPASIKSLPSNGQNQDIVSMGLIAARKSLRLADNIENIMAVMLGACHQAAHLKDVGEYSPLTRRFHQMLAELVPVYRDDSPLCDIIATVREFLGSGRVTAYLDEHVVLAR
ncbi:MAG: tyrosine 2,3-aminomutase [Myxococcaceae bacterium]|nr:tyrosine 2,3-aminomutase [Myxococcaceae bacterium]